MDQPTALPRKKAPRRTAERILEVALDLFNRRGEPHVSTQMLAAELHISPGNLHYHYPTKAELVNALYDHFESEHGTALGETSAATDGSALMHWLMAVHDVVWGYRFLFRDTCDLLTRNRHVETRLPQVLERQHQTLLQRLQSWSAPSPGCPDIGTLATSVQLVLIHWVGHEYLRDPRHALENEQTAAVAERVRTQLAGLLQRQSAEAAPTP